MTIATKIGKALLIASLLLGSLTYAQDDPPTDDPPIDNDLPPTDDPPIGAPIDEGILYLVLAGFLFAGKIFFDKHNNGLYKNEDHL